MTLTDGRAGGPRYRQLGNALQKRIEDGVYAIGDLLPTEIELCEEFAVSRHTVREALRRLIDAGLVKRRQGSGSQVVASSVQGNYTQSMRSLRELFQYANDTVFRIKSMSNSVPDPAYAAHLGDAMDKPWLTVEGIRLDADGTTPICFSIVLINDVFAGVADGLGGFGGAIYSLVEERFGVTVADVEQEIRAEPMSKKAARELGVSSRIWAVRVIRRYVGEDGQLIMMSVNYHPGDRFSYTMHLRRDPAKGRA